METVKPRKDKKKKRAMATEEPPKDKKAKKPKKSKKEGKAHAKETQEEEEEEVAPATEKEDAEEDAKEEDNHPPIVKELKGLHSKCLELELELSKEIQKLNDKYALKQQPFYDERAKLLAACPEGEEAKGTPALGGFWLQAMKNHPYAREFIMEWDEPVLSYLTDVTKTDLDPEDSYLGFKLSFHFSENPYFENEVLEKEYHTYADITSSSQGPETRVGLKKIDCTEVDWHPGKDITVEKNSKKGPVKLKKGKAKNKEKAEPRESFFRTFFRNIDPDEGFPEDLLPQDQELDEEEYEDAAEQYMDNELQVAFAFRDQIIKSAVQWYTGEAEKEMIDEGQGYGQMDDEEYDSEDGSDEEDASGEISEEGSQDEGEDESEQEEGKEDVDADGGSEEQVKIEEVNAEEAPEIEEIQTEGTKQEAKKKAKMKNRRKGGMEINAEDGSDLLALAPPGHDIKDRIPGLFVFATVFLALACFKRARGFRRSTRGREPLIMT